jgi:flagellar basal-body rod modification protein FlgD
MDVNAASSGTGASPSASATAQSGLTDNFDTFLKLLTTQMQNQDPLNPMDSSQFTQQLVQFSGVEQAIKTNSNLETLISMVSSNNLSNAMGYLGKQVEANVPFTSLKDGSATWDYSLGANASKTDLQITDINGKVVYKTDGALEAGDHSFTWNGHDMNGNALPDGVYMLTVGAVSGTGTDVSTQVTLKGAVSDINIVDGSPVLSVNGVPIPSSAVVTIHEPDSTQT